MSQSVQQESLDGIVARLWNVLELCADQLRDTINHFSDVKTAKEKQRLLEAQKLLVSLEAIVEGYEKNGKWEWGIDPNPSKDS